MSTYKETTEVLLWPDSFTRHKTQMPMHAISRGYPRIVHPFDAVSPIITTFGPHPKSGSEKQEGKNRKEEWWWWLRRLGAVGIIHINTATTV